MYEVKNIVERYCPVMGCNMPLEIKYDSTGKRIDTCMGEDICSKQRGGCTNSLRSQGGTK